MRKLTLCFIISFCFLSTLLAQYTIGLKSSFQQTKEFDITSFNRDDICFFIPNRNYNHFSISSIAYFNQSKHFNMGMEPNVTLTKNQKNESRNNAKWVSFSLPLVLKIPFYIYNEKFQIYPKLGFQTNINFYFDDKNQLISLNSNDQINPLIDPPRTSSTQKFNYDFNPIIGMGLGIQVGKKRIILESNYNFPSSNYDKNLKRTPLSLEFSIGFTTDLEKLK